MPQIIVENLVKTFHVAERTAGLLGAFAGLVKRRHRTVTALNGVSFSMEAGELLGYIGPNGAGKSTTVKILSGILVPDSGNVEVLGLTPWKSRIKVVRKIGVVFGQRTQLWWDLPVIESFELLREIYGLSHAEYKHNLDEFIELLSLCDVLNVPVRQLSLGQRMRCDLAAAFLHSPKIVYLDEPTIGLDAISKLAVRDFIRKINREREVTIILTTHDMDDIEALCHRIMVIHEGNILIDGTISDLRAMVTKDRLLTVILADENGEISDSDAEVVSRDGRQVTLRFNPEAVPPSELISRIVAKHNISDLFVENPPIEEIVAKIYRGFQR